MCRCYTRTLFADWYVDLCSNADLDHFAAEFNGFANAERSVGRRLYSNIQRPYSRKWRSKAIACVNPARSITVKLSASQYE